jgi:multicomponent K+:H+ antiporter subunit E
VTRRVLLRLFPAPVLSLSLLVLWLVLQRSVAPVDLLLGAIVAVVMPILSRSLRPSRARMRRPLVLARLVLSVGRDVLGSNLRVARGVLQAPWRAPRSAFVRVPLDLRDASGLAALATITTAIPGTVWAEISLDRSMLLLHVFDLDDEASFIADFKARYERPLMEIFQ